MLINKASYWLLVLVVGSALCFGIYKLWAHFMCAHNSVHPTGIYGNSMEKTLAIIKPDAVKAGHSGSIIKHIETAGFHVAGMKKIQLTQAQAEQFYAVHKARPFFGELVQFMISGPVVVMALAKHDAIVAWRTLMGATNPAQADAGTMRKLYGTSVGENATHGSDAPETAAQEVSFFFAGSDLL
jgi:nucleoside-diphosphate kinase